MRGTVRAGSMMRLVATNRITGEEWRALDSSPEAARFLAFLDEYAALPAVAEAKQRSFALLDAQPADRLLDAGCGTGSDAVTMAGAVRPGGEVVGLDSSSLAIATAQARYGGEPDVRFQRGEITALPFADAYFTAVRADRVLLHLDKPIFALHELVRVTRPGGRVVLSETRTTGTSQRPSRDPHRHPHGDLVPALPLILEHLGVCNVVVERHDRQVELSDDSIAVLGLCDNIVTINVFHVAGEREA